jgi:putative MATE family efflux protein
MYNVVDSIFVAQISENALTAVSIAFPIQGFMIAAAVGTGLGINALLSKSLGEKNFDVANRSALNGIFLAWISCILFIIVGVFFSEAFFRSQTNIEEIIKFGTDYTMIVCVLSFGIFNQVTFERLLISTGKTHYAMISQTLGALVNIALDPIFIFGMFGLPKLEVKGAALATVIGQCLSAFVALYFNLKKNKELNLSLSGFRPNLKIIKKIYSVGFPAIMMQGIGSIMIYGFNRILISFTPTAAAVFGAYFKLQSFVFMPVFGLSNGMVPIIAYNYGAKNSRRIIQTIKLGIYYATAIMFIGCAVFEIIPSQLLSMFKASGQMLAIGVPALRIICFHFVFAGFCVISISIFQALGNGLTSLYISIARQLLILLPVAWLMSLTNVLNNVWWSFPIAEFFTLLLSAFLLKQLYRSKIKPL